MRVTRSAEGSDRLEELAHVRFVPLIGQAGWPEADAVDDPDARLTLHRVLPEEEGNAP